jgi:hypothetical protein
MTLPKLSISSKPKRLRAANLPTLRDVDASPSGNNSRINYNPCRGGIHGKSRWAGDHCVAVEDRENESGESAAAR